MLAPPRSLYVLAPPPHVPAIDYDGGGRVGVALTRQLPELSPKRRRFRLEDPRRFAQGFGGKGLVGANASPEDQFDVVVAHASVSVDIASQGLKQREALGANRVTQAERSIVGG